MSPYEFLVSDKRGERALKKEKNWGEKKNQNFLLMKLRVIFLGKMDNGISTFNKILIEKMEANHRGKRENINQ